MKRALSSAVTLLISWACFGFIAYWLTTEVDAACTRWMERGLYAECVAPAGWILMVVTLIFIVSSGTLAYLAIRNR